MDFRFGGRDSAHRLYDGTWECGVGCKNLRHTDANALNIILSDHPAFAPPALWPGLALIILVLSLKKPP